MWFCVNRNRQLQRTRRRRARTAIDVTRKDQEKVTNANPGTRRASKRARRRDQRVENGAKEKKKSRNNHKYTRGAQRVLLIATPRITASEGNRGTTDACRRRSTSARCRCDRRRSASPTDAEAPIPPTSRRRGHRHKDASIPRRSMAGMLR